MEKRVPSLADLPSPPRGKVGWPWSQASHSTPKTLPDGTPWPRFSIVTPSYNQAEFIEETIRSVLLQGYPNLEYIIVDGGSTDNSVEIIRKYERYLSYWVSEPDRGQADAINEGFAHATGEIVAWLNSDDRYLPNALNQVARKFVQDPALGLVFGKMEIILGHVTREIGYPVAPRRMLETLNLPYQQTCFFRELVLNQVGLLDPSFNYVMDADILLKLMSNSSFVYLPTVLASFKIHADSKTNTSEENFARELLSLLDRVLANKDRYPRLRDLGDKRIECIFYRRASKHFYMGNCFRESLHCLRLALKAYPPSAFEILADEGIGWVIRSCMPPNWYRQMSAFYRSNIGSRHVS